MGDQVVYFRRYLTDVKKKDDGAGSFGGSAVIISLMFAYIVNIIDPKYSFTLLQLIIEPPCPAMVLETLQCAAARWRATLLPSRLIRDKDKMCRAS